MNCKDHQVLYVKHAEDPKHMRPHVTSYPETIFLLACHSEVQKGTYLHRSVMFRMLSIFFLLRAELK